MRRLIPWVVILAVVGLAVWGGTYLFSKSGEGPGKSAVASGDPAEGNDPSQPLIPDAGNPPAGTHNPAGTTNPGALGRPDGVPPGPGDPATPALTAAELYTQAIVVEEELGIAAAVPKYEDLMQKEPGGEAAAKAARKLAGYYAGRNDSARAEQYYKLALLSYHWTFADRKAIREALDGLATPAPAPAQDPATLTCKVKKGDSLSQIAKRYKITAAHLKKLNNLDTDLIRIGDELRVVQGPFDAYIDKSDLTLTIKHKGQFVKQFKVGLGKGNRTPVGTYSVITKLVDPDWYTREGVVPAGDPNNILGTRWLGFKGSYGIHGTTDPASIGLYSSNGCVRMLNAEVEEIYALLVRKHSKVVITD